ncbi:YlcG family protein [Escherichia coli]|nr:YlcG family protein [Escherichia coli]HCQ7387912.1 YlcG family protein [Escherichia coli]
MSRDVIERIRDRWQKLRLLRSRGTVLVDYNLGPTCARTDTLTPSSYCCH